MKTIAALVTTAAALAGAAAYASGPVRSEIIVTRDSLSLPQGCSPRETADLVVRFLGAINRGSEADLDRALARDGRKAPAFRWVSVTAPPDGHFVAYSRAAALRYLAERHTRGEHLQLRQVDVGRSWVSRSVALAFELARRTSSAATAGTEALHGKAEVHCPSRTIYVWSMGAGKASVCPAPPGWGPMSAPLACARSGRPTTVDEVGPTYRPPRSVPLPGRCAPEAVEGRLLRTLRALNVGAGAAFAENFVPADSAGSTRLRLAGAQTFSSRRALSAFAVDRYQAGVGWTLYALAAPSAAERFYRLALAIDGPDRTPREARGRLFVECRTGLISRLALPTAGA